MYTQNTKCPLQEMLLLNHVNAIMTKYVLTSPLYYTEKLGQLLYASSPYLLPHWKVLPAVSQSQISTLLASSS